MLNEQRAQLQPTSKKRTTASPARDSRDLLRLRLSRPVLIGVVSRHQNGSSERFCMRCQWCPQLLLNIKTASTRVTDRFACRMPATGKKRKLAELSVRPCGIFITMIFDTSVRLAAAKQ